jgi:hypothetical protein
MQIYGRAVKMHYVMSWTPINRLLKPPDRSFFLFGARGTGKSTWLRKVFPNALILDLLDTSLQLQLTVNPHASDLFRIFCAFFAVKQYPTSLQ